MSQLRSFVVVGLLSSQFRELESRLKGVATLKHLSADSAKTKGRFKDFPHADHCVLVTKFISHCSIRAAEYTFGKSAVFTVHGGITAVVSAIKKVSNNTTRSKNER